VFAPNWDPIDFKGALYGGLIGQIEAVDLKVKEVGLRYADTSGKQSLTGFEGEKTEHHLTMRGNGIERPAGLAISATLEKFEQGGKAIEVEVRA
jgi:hypothetical protein